MFEVVDVSEWEPVGAEQLGSKYKVWLEEPGEKQRRWLCKPNTEHGQSGRLREEDWSEKIASHLGRGLGVPCARVELAVLHGIRAVISLNVAPDRSLAHGNELMYGFDRTYPKDTVREVEAYTLSRVKAALAGAGPPPAFDGPEQASAFDVFAGYLVLDALIANTDRHHENWAITTQSGSDHRLLAPSYDHGTSLGFQLDEAERERRLASVSGADTVAAWASRGQSKHFSGRPRLVELARSALKMIEEPVASYWLDQLRKMDHTAVVSIIEEVPTDRMSRHARTFVAQVLDTNRTRLLACLD